MATTPNGRRSIPPASPGINNRNNANNPNSNLSHSVQRLSISTSSSRPSSPQINSPSRLGHRTPTVSSSGGRTPSRSPLRRSSSSMSLDARASTPTLLRKASMNSLHGVGSSVTPSRSSPSRRSSTAQFVNMSTLTGKKSPLSEIEDMEPTLPRYTAASIASNHFKAELDLHNNAEDDRPTDTIAILHDDCYGHRYSRPRTSKASLSTIVERPERIHASILGLSVAYVRLGERHAEGRFPLHPNKDASAIPSTPFRIRKSTRRLALSSQAVTNVHGVKWMEELKIMCNNAEARLAMNGKELTRPDMTRSPEEGAPAKLHEGDLFLCSESLNAMEGALGAVCEGVDTVFQGSASGKGPHRAFVAIRPPGHHCSASYPSGFCWVNNVHVGISHAALTHGLTHAAIIDFDLHHGDGSQAIAWDHNQRATNLPKNAAPWKKTSIGYFSLHDINSYPCEMGDEEKVKNASLCIENAHGQSIWNVHLLPWKSESEFWELYETKYSILLEKTRNYLRSQTERLRLLPNGPKPKAAIFLSAGFDASEWESSGMQRHKVNVPTEFYARLTRDVVRLAAEEGTGVEGRVISVLEGGYSDRALCTGVFSHLSGMVCGSPVSIEKETEHSGLAYEMGQKIGAFNGTENVKVEPVTSGVQSYDPSWWSLPLLEELDATINPPPPPELKKVRDPTVPTYSSPTQSFINKVSSPSRRGTGLSNGSPRPVSSRPPSPPPPDVDWTVAAHELSKLLIPTERQTMSCKPEDLSAEATRARRDRQSILTVPAPGTEVPEIPNQRMALRARKPVKSVIETAEEDARKKVAAKASRRKTVAGPSVLATEKATTNGVSSSADPSYTRPTSQSARRLSLASNTSDSTARSVIHSRAPSTSSVILPPRRVSSQTIRPDSSMSARGPSIPPPAIKKPRAPTQPRAEPIKSSRVRRKSPLNEESLATVQDNAASRSVSSSTLPPRPVPKASQSDDMDSLLSGMKKIKITLTTKAQRETRELAKQAAKPAPAPAKAAPRPAARTARSKLADKSTNGKVQKPEVEATSASPIVPEPAPGAEAQPLPESVQNVVSPVQSLPVLQPAQTYQPSDVPLPPSSPPTGPIFGQPSLSSHLQQPSSRPTTARKTSTPNSDVFVSYQPEGPTPEVHEQQNPIQWLPPNTGTPSPMKRGNLPVFTSTGAIPFGARPASHFGFAASQTQGTAVMAEEENKDVDMREIPETPDR